MTFEQATCLFAVHKVMFDEFNVMFEQLSKEHQEAGAMLAATASSDLKAAEMLMDLALALKAGLPDLARQASTAAARAYKRQASKRAKNAAEHRYSRPGSAREKTEAIRRAWASGKFSSRDRCAEEECAALGMSFSTARKALRNIPKPS